MRTHQPKSGMMEGGGYYTEHSAPQEAYGELAFRWLEEAAVEVPLPEGSAPLLLADMGAAGGGNSLEPMRRAITAYRARDPARQIQVVHTDIPSNDFSALLQFVESSELSYRRLSGTYAYVAGRSFYERLFPDRVLSLGWSSIAVHWLSRIPEPIPNQVYSSFATGAVREAFAAQAKTDWEAFLHHRAQELRQGGRLIVIGGARRDDDISDAEGLMSMAYDALNALVDAGDLNPEEVRRMTIPTWNRTASEFAEPFMKGAIAGQLELRRLEARALPDEFLVALQRGGNLETYRDSVVGFFRAAFETSLWSSLDPGRDPASVAAIAGTFRQRLGERILANPAEAACLWHVVILDIARR